MITVEGSNFMYLELIEYLNDTYPLYNITVKEYDLLEIKDDNNRTFMIADYCKPRKTQVSIEKFGISKIEIELQIISPYEIIKHMLKIDKVVTYLMGIITKRNFLDNNRTSIGELEYKSIQLKIYNMELELDRICDEYKLYYNVSGMWATGRVDYELKYGEKYFGIGKVL